MRETKQKFPTAPVLGFWSDLQASAADYTSVLFHSADLLAAWRAGDATAREALLQGYRWLIYEASRDRKWPPENTHGRGYRDHLWGGLREALTNAVDALRFGKKACEKPDADAFIRNELSRAASDFYRYEITRNLTVPRSTNATRRRNKQSEYPTLKRQTHIKQRDSRRGKHDVRLVEAFNILETPTPSHDPRLYVEETPLESLVFGLIRAGMSEREIAESTGHTQHAIKKMKAAMISRIRTA